MKYEVEFRATSGETKRVIVTLEPDEVRSVNALLALRGSDEAGLMAESYASRAGYRSAPDGFDFVAATQSRLRYHDLGGSQTLESRVAAVRGLGAALG